MLIKKIQIAQIIFMSVLIAVDTSFGKPPSISTKWMHHDHLNTHWLWEVTGNLDMTNNLHHAIKNLSYQWIINKDQMVILVLKIDKFALNYLTLKQEIGTLKFNFEISVHLQRFMFFKFKRPTADIKVNGMWCRFESEGFFEKDSAVLVDREWLPLSNGKQSGSTQKQAMPYKKANLVFPKSNWYREFLYRIRSVSRCKKYAPGFQHFQQIHKIRLL